MLKQHGYCGHVNGAVVFLSVLYNGSNLFSVCLIMVSDMPALRSDSITNNYMKLASRMGCHCRKFVKLARSVLSVLHIRKISKISVLLVQWLSKQQQQLLQQISAFSMFYQFADI